MTIRMMTDATQSTLSQNDHQPKPLQNGFNPDFSHSEVDQSSSPPTEVSKEQLPASRTTTEYEGDAAELVVANMLDRHFAGGKHLMLSPDGRFWHYDSRGLAARLRSMDIRQSSRNNSGQSGQRPKDRAPAGTGSHLVEGKSGRCRRSAGFQRNSYSHHQLRQRRALAYAGWRR